MYSDISERTSNVFVNYMPADLDDDGLVGLFESYGVIQSAKVMRDANTGVSRCFGFVKFQDINQATAAINTMNGAKIGTKSLLVKYANINHNKSTPQVEEPSTPSNNLFVKGLPVDINQEQLKTIFRPYGNIVETKILKDTYNGDNTSGISRGMAFVRYTSLQEATAAIQGLNNTTIPGEAKSISVKYADTEEERNERKQKTVRKGQQLQRFNPYPQMQPAVNNVFAQHYGQMIAAAQMGNMTFDPASGHPQSNVPNGQGLPFSPVQTQSGAVYDTSGLPDSNMYINNLPPEADDALLYRLFSPCGAISSVKTIKDASSGLCAGYGFVKMANYFDAYSAIQNINGATVGDRVLQVSFKKNSRSTTQ